MKEKLGIYIHIPFCKSKCAYCDFYSLAGQEGRMQDYQKALIAHIKETAPLAAGHQVDTIYFGGGTPSYYGDKRLRQLLALVKKHFNVTKNAEITVEVNPESVEFKAVRRLRWAGFNRISMGMQTVHPQELLAIARPHTPEDSLTAVAAVRRAKIKNMSLDLIFGLPQQSLQSWQETVEAAIAMNPEHLSCYGLKVEEGTPLAKRVEDGELLPDDDTQADLYLWTVERLKEAGYIQYEISNFAKVGYESRHNLRYWLMRPYLGFGPGAHSDFGGRRYSFMRDLEGYISGVLGGGSIVDSEDRILEQERGGEYLMLRLRTSRGIEEWEYRRQYFREFAPLDSRLDYFRSHGWAEKTVEGRWRLTPEGMLISNQLIGDLMERQEKEQLEQRIIDARTKFGKQKDSSKITEKIN